MANCAIYQKNSDEITYFIKDCIQEGRNFKGSNGSAMGVKEFLFDVKWTEDIAEPIFNEENIQIGFDKKVSELSDAKIYENKVISTEEDVNRIIREKIAERYSITDEIKILRLKLSGDDKEWLEYTKYVEDIIQKATIYKEEVLKEIKNG